MAVPSTLNPQHAEDTGLATVVEAYNPSQDNYQLARLRLENNARKIREHNERIADLNKWYKPPTNYFAPDAAKIMEGHQQLVNLGTEFMSKGVDWRDPLNKEAYLAMQNLISKNNALASQSKEDQMRYEMLLKNFDPNKADAAHFNNRMQEYVSKPLGERHNMPMDFSRPLFDEFSIFDIMKPGMMKPENDEEAKQLFGLLMGTSEGQQWYANGLNSTTGAWNDVNEAEKFFVDSMQYTYPKAKAAPKPKATKAPVPEYDKDFSFSKQTKNGVTEVYATKRGTNSNLSPFMVNVDGEEVDFSFIKFTDERGKQEAYGTIEVPEHRDAAGKKIEKSTKKVYVDLDSNQGAFDSVFQGWNVNDYLKNSGSSQDTKQPEAAPAETTNKWSKYKRK